MYVVLYLQFCINLCQEAIAQNSFHDCPPYMNRISRGDTKAAFESCDHVVDGEVKIGSQEHFYMETHSVRVVPAGEDGEIAVYGGEQYIQAVQVNNAITNSTTSC